MSERPEGRLVQSAHSAKAGLQCFSAEDGEKSANDDAVAVVASDSASDGLSPLSLEQVRVYQFFSMKNSIFRTR